MASFLRFLFFLAVASSATACDRCVHQTKLAYFSKISGGACGYGSLADGFNGGHLATAAPSLYKEGAGCGACFQVWCKDLTLCDPKGTTVMVIDMKPSNKTDLVVSSKAFRAMANKGMDQSLLKQKMVDVDYKRVPCNLMKKNLAIRVEESSEKPNYLAIQILYQGGQTEIVGMEVAQVGMPNWVSMSRKNGAVWEASKVPNGALQLRMIVIGGYDAKWFFAENALPASWKAGVIYDTGVQITDIAQDGCNPCEN